jgi:hypothetical protein
MDTSYLGISEKLSGFEMLNGFRMDEGYRENSDTTEYHHDESDITEYRDEFYREISRRVL